MSNAGISEQIILKRAGRRKNVRHGGTLCCKCYVAPPALGQRYCRKCHNTAQLASYHRKQARLKALEDQQSKGIDNGQAKGPGRGNEAS